MTNTLQIAARVFLIAAVCATAQPLWAAPGDKPVAPLPALGSGVTLSFLLVVPGVAVVPTLPPAPELVCA